LYTAIEI